MVAKCRKIKRVISLFSRKEENYKDNTKNDMDLD